MEQRITTELARLRENREGFIKEAERQVAMMDGAIMALEQLLKQQPDQPSNGAEKV